jgi:ribonuclease P protein component
MGKLTFSKEERLCKEIWIKELFNRGSSFNLYPFRVIYLAHPEPDFLFNQVLISVSVRNFGRAVDRNLLKRRIREGYRMEKTLLSADQRRLIAYIYTSTSIEDLGRIRESIVQSMEFILADKGHRKMKKEIKGK